MYRKEHWEQDFYQDNLLKYECCDCGKEFIVGEELQKDCPMGYLVCPYCGQSNVECACQTENDQLEEMALGCIGIYINKRDISMATKGIIEPQNYKRQAEQLLSDLKANAGTEPVRKQPLL